MGDTSKQEYDYTVDNILWMYVSPFIFLLGVVGNLFVVIIFMCTARHKMRKTSTALYLIVMGFADMGFLTCGLLPEWLEKCGFFVLNAIHPSLCKAEKFLFYFSGDVAIWVTCAFSVDRACAVRSPMKKPWFCRRRSSVYCCIIVAILALTKNAHVFWTRGLTLRSPPEAVDEVLNTTSSIALIGESAVDRYRCGRPEPYTYFEMYVRPLIVLAVVHAIPFAIIAVCNIIIINCLLKARKNRGAWCNAENNLKHTVPLCLSASFAFLVCITPSMVLHIGKPYWESNPGDSYHVSKTVSDQMAYLNHAINFFLYCLTGQASRVEFYYLFTGKRRNSKRDSYAYTAAINLDRRRKSSAVGTPNCKRHCSTPLTLSREDLDAALKQMDSHESKTMRCCCC